MEPDGGGESWSGFEERRERKERDLATVRFGHDAFDRTVVSDSTVTQFHGLDHEFQPHRLFPRFRRLRSLGQGFEEGNVEVEENHPVLGFQLQLEREREREVFCFEVRFGRTRRKKKQTNELVEGEVRPSKP